VAVSGGTSGDAKDGNFLFLNHPISGEHDFETYPQFLPRHIFVIYDIICRGLQTSRIISKWIHGIWP